MEFRNTTLGNGLEIVAECNAEAHSSALGFFVQTGARDETADVAGVSHFLEHMMFKGTATRSAEDVNREFDEMGAHYNAFTSEESTVYYAAVLPEFQETIVQLLGDILRPALRKEDFDTEKQVIIEEIKMYEDQPPFGADDKCRAAHFGRHPLGQSVLGTAESIAALPVEAMRRYFARRYSPANIVLAAAGRIDFDALVGTAEKVCGGWEQIDAPREISPVATKSGFEVISKPSATQEYLLEMSDAPSATDDDRYAAKLLTTILGDDSGSRLYWELVDPGLAENASLHHYEYMGAGAFLTYLSCDPEFAAENLQRVLDVYRQAEKDGFTAAELAQAKSKINSRVVLGSERPRGRLFSVGTNWTHRRTYRSVTDDLDAVEAITLEQLAAVLAKYPLSRSTSVAIGPLDRLPPPN
ncbi:MAG TPA: pitrilysin family protein [Pirellulales bacterium]|jgi:predicted Zn-dependent peptidase|nr:pitrilysin family protein [Pirellulales bacterium]